MLQYCTDFNTIRTKCSLIFLIFHFRRCHSKLSLEAFSEIAEVIENCQHRHLRNAILLGFSFES